MDGAIKVDLNRITRGEFSELMDANRAGRLTSEATAELVARVVVEWPFEPEISEAGFFELGLLDSRRVEDAVTGALNDLAKKN